MTKLHWKMLLPLLAWLVSYAHAAEPASTAWIVNPSVSGNPALARVQPEVHSVTVTERTIEIRSAGISLYDFGPFQTPSNPVERLRQLSFRIPHRPTLATKSFASLRPDAVGVFVNGLPIYHQFESNSYQGQNLWHFDAIAQGDNGTWTAGGHPRQPVANETQHAFAPGLLAKLIADNSGHSPIIGYAFDGFPIYGPWGFANAGGTGGLRRMRSSYRLRAIKQRGNWPDGAQLTPGQQGPAVNAEFPLGTFAEDYEFVAGAGELDEFNGRFTQTPEYPQGTYAYFLSTDAQGRLAFPYLLAHQYRGQISDEELNAAMRDHAGESCPNIASKELLRDKQDSLELKVEGAALAANQPVRLSFQASDAQGRAIRHLEYMHERPLHLIIVSEDLAEFAHIHPELVAGNRYEVAHTFAHGVRYRLYADFTSPGATQHIASFTLTIGGKPRPAKPLATDATLTKETNGLRITLATQQQLRAGEDIALAFTVRDAATNQAINDLEPYLGAWAHFVIIDDKLQSFIHAHPLESAETNLAATHTHSALPPGPSPAEIRTLTSFPRAGLYKLWAQFQRNGEVIIQPFTLRVAEAQPVTQAKLEIPPDAIKVTIGANGFQPDILNVDSSSPITLAITRDAQPNCGNKIVFAALRISRDLPLGQTVLISLPAQKAGELRFTCGMGMYRGALVIH